MGLNAGRAIFMSWKDNENGPGFETLFYEEYPVMRAIIAEGTGYSIVKLIGGSPAESEGQFERQGTYGNLKFRHSGKIDVPDHPTRRWATKVRGSNSMKIVVGGYMIERRDNGQRSYNVYIYPPDYTKGGEPWIGAYMTGVDYYAAEKAIQFARDAIQNAVSDQVVSSAIRSRAISKDTEKWISSNPLLAARLGKSVDNLQPDFTGLENEETREEKEDAVMEEVGNEREDNNESNERKPLEEMTIEELRREISRLESE